LDADQLEELRLLTNAQMDSHSPFAYLLGGQPPCGADQARQDARLVCRSERAWGCGAVWCAVAAWAVSVRRLMGVALSVLGCLTTRHDRR
jgi:hypothetical protein